MAEKVTSGQPWRPPPAADQNAWSEAAEFYQRHQQLGRGGQTDAPLHRHDVIKIQNGSGASLVRGTALEIGDLLISNIEPGGYYFEGDTPSDVDKPYAILRQPIASTYTNEAVVSGVCLARVDVQNTSHAYATLVKSSSVLDSTSMGTIRILNSLSSTGVQECLVQLGPAIKKPLILFTADGDFTTSTSIFTGTITGQFGYGMDADTGTSVSIYNKPVDGADYQFYGSKDGIGYAEWWEGTKYRLIQFDFECP